MVKGVDMGILAGKVRIFFWQSSKVLSRLDLDGSYIVKLRRIALGVARGILRVGDAAGELGLPELFRPEWSMPVTW